MMIFLNAGIKIIYFSQLACSGFFYYVSGIAGYLFIPCYKIRMFNNNSEILF